MARKQKSKICFITYNDSAELRTGMNGRAISSPFLKVEERVPEPMGYIDEQEDEIEDFEAGEKTFFKMVKQIIEVLKKHKIGYEFNQGNDVFEVSSYHAEVDHTIEKAIFAEDGYFYFTNKNFEKDYCCTKSIRQFSTFLATQKNLVRYGNA